MLSFCEAPVELQQEGGAIAEVTTPPKGRAKEFPFLEDKGTGTKQANRPAGSAGSLGRPAIDDSTPKKLNAAVLDYPCRLTEAGGSPPPKRMRTQGPSTDTTRRPVGLPGPVGARHRDPTED